MALVPTAFALVVAGFDFAVAALCWGWPRGELWPLGTRLTSIAMALAGLTSIAAAMVMAGLAPDLAMRAFAALATVSFVAGTAAVIPSDAPRAARYRTWLALLSVPVPLGLALALETSPVVSAGPGVPSVVLTLRSAALFAVTCGAFQVVEAVAIAAFWPKSQTRASLPAVGLVFLAGFIDVAAMLGKPLPLVGAVTAAVIASGFIASRMLAQFRVALEGAEGRVPGFALQRFLGAGGMAEVFIAEAVGLFGKKRVAAVKRVRRDLVDNVELCAMFLEEARLAAELHHPNIVEVLSFGTGGAGSHVRPYIAMELVDGVSLAMLVRHAAAARQPLPLSAVVEIGVSLASALHYAHTLRDHDGKLLSIVHRDVSPHNVLISREGVVKLIDFGIARAATRATHTKTGHMRGKLAYASPEQVAATGVDARSDVFSLGVLLYEAACLTRPFTGDSEPAVVSAILDGRRQKLIELRPDAGSLADAIERALDVDPTARWQSAAELGEALDAAMKRQRPGSEVLRDLVASTKHADESSPPASTGPVLEMAATTMTGSSMPSGATETVADPHSVARGQRGERERSRRLELIDELDELAATLIFVRRERGRSRGETHVVQGGVGAVVGAGELGARYDVGAGSGRVRRRHAVAFDGLHFIADEAQRTPEGSAHGAAVEIHLGERIEPIGQRAPRRRR
ncbi:MAG: protein kinase [Myxococcales bacterium]|nr:protein kinase [Myxococcales bacterium]